MNNGIKRGKFLALEGIDGSGKTTQLRLLHRRLTEAGVPCYATQEPSDGPVGKLLRQVLTGEIQADGRVAAGLFASDRLDHLTRRGDGLLEKLAAGVTVLTDRYYFSSYAYNGMEADLDWVIEINRLSAELLRPDVTIFLDVPVEQAMARIRINRDHVERYEQEDRLRAVREKFFEVFRRMEGQENVVVVDGSGEAAEVAERVWAAASGALRG